MVYWQLFVIFVKIGFISFGGGYAVIPMVQYEVERNGWMTDAAFQNAVTIAGMAPGPIAVNSATLIGYEIGGTAGAVIATLGIVLPSLLVILIIAGLFYKFHHNKWVKSSFYGLRPIITGLIAYAAIHFGFLGKQETAMTWTTVATLLIAAAAAFGLLKYRLHPLTVIVACGVAGVILF